MTHSYRHTPISGITIAKTDSYFKRFASKRLRRRVKVLLDCGQYETLPHSYEVTNPYQSMKDGKRWFDPVKFPNILRK